MNFTSTRRVLVAVLALFIVSQSAFAQNVFWSENFGGGAIPTGWSNNDPNDPTLLWEYETDSARSTVSFNGVPFFSTTVANGFVMFDSDGYGQLANGHDARLTTSAISCTGQSTVFARFESQYTPFAASAVAELGVSTDGTTFTYYPLFAQVVAGTGSISTARTITELDISTIAANQATVYLQFRWQGNYEYAWKIDDITLQDSGTPLPSDNLALGDFFYVPDNFGTPVTQIDSDTFDFFGVDVYNIGASDQTNVVAYAEIIDAAQNTLWIDSVNLGTIPAGFPDSIFDATFTNFYVPSQLAVGNYAVVYSITSDGSDVDMTDNVVGAVFQVTDSIYRKDAGISTGLRPGNGGDYLMGNVYRTGENFVAGDFLASTVTFAAAANSTDPLPGKSVTIWLVEVSDNVDAGYDNFDVTGDINSNADLTVVGFATYTFSPQAANYDLNTVDIEDLATGNKAVPLKPGTRYFVMIDYAGTSNTAYQAVGSQINMFQVSTILYSSQWFLGGFGADYTAVARLTVRAKETSTRNVELKNATLEVFPNPARDFATVNVAFDKSTNADLFVTDITGKVVYFQSLNNATQERLTLDTSNFAAGTYVVKIGTKEGTKTQRLVVIK